jgi:O-antigen ligase
VTQNLRDVRVTRDWPMLLHKLRQSPVIGYGLGVFGFAALSAAERRGPVTDPLGVDNYYLTLALNTGIIGLVLFLVLVCAVLRNGLRGLSLGNGQGSRNVLVGLIAGLLVFLASGLFSNLIESFPISAFFWFIVGAISAWPAGSRAIYPLDHQRLN